MTEKSVSTLLLCALASACSVDTSPTSDTDAEFRVQYDRMATMFRVSAAPFGPSAEAELARGAIHVVAMDADGQPMHAVDGTPVRYTCGAILIAPSYIVTAGHCVSSDDILDPETTPVMLEMFPVEADLDWESGMELTTPGTWWEFEHDPLTGADGYHSESYDCRLLQRCGEDWGPQIACDHPDSDVALLRCEGLPGDKYGFVPVAEQDLDKAPVFMPWAHEVYDFEGFFGDDLLYDHYNKRNPVSSNIHYMGGGRNQLLPLVSPGWTKGDLAWSNMKLGFEDALGVRWTDLMGCHGTSGSPVLQWNATKGTYEYLGPISRGTFFNASVPGGMPESNQLCQEPGLHGSGQQNLAYSKLEFTQTVAENADDCSSLYDKGPLLQLQCVLDRLDLVWEEIHWPWDIYQCLTCPPPWLDLGRVMEPLVDIAVERPFTTPVVVEAGTRHRVSAIVVPSGKEVAVVSLHNRAGERLATVEAAGDASSFAVLQGSFVAGADEALTISVESGAAMVTRIAVAPIDRANGFERMVDRLGVDMVPSAAPRTKAVAMRIAAGGKGDLVAVLGAGERMLMTREALPNAAMSMRFAIAGEARLRAGLVLANGEEIVREVAIRDGAAEVAFDAPGSAPIAVFLEHGDEGVDVEIDDVLITER